MSQAVKAKYAKHYGPYLGMHDYFCAFGADTRRFGRNLTLVVYFVTSLMLGRPSTSKNEASTVLGMMATSTSVIVQGPLVT